MPQTSLLECSQCESTETEMVAGSPYCADCRGENFSVCDRCDDETANDDICHSSGGDCYCRDCYDHIYTVCDNCSHECRRDDTQDHNGNTYCEGCADEHLNSCNDCGNIYHVDDSPYNNHHDRPVCIDCASNYSHCDECENTIRAEDSYYSERDDRTYCSNCLPSSSRVADFESVPFSLEGLSYRRIKSTRRFGVELETSESDGADDLEGEVYFGATEDGSISGSEFVSTILAGDQGLDAIRDFCKLARGFDVDSTCGYHLHCDVSRLSERELFAVTMAYWLTQRVWQSFVPKARRSNTYCRSLPYDDYDIIDFADNASFSEFVDHNFTGTDSGYDNRYTWFNVTAYNKHRTFEVRLHTGTLDAVKINNWVMAHLRFIDYVASRTFEQLFELFQNNPFEAIGKIIGRDLQEYYRKRANKFGTTYGR